MRRLLTGPRIALTTMLLVAVVSIVVVAVTGGGADVFGPVIVFGVALAAVLGVTLTTSRRA